MKRTRLPNRRACVTFNKDVQGHACTISHGFGKNPDDGVKEIFINAEKSGALEAILRDGAVLASIALQHGASVEELARSTTRNPDGSPSSPVGVVLDDMVTG
jgi:hypothetical protein